MDIAVIVGNPKPRSRTLEAAVLLAEQLGGGSPNVVVDVIDLASGLLGWGDPVVAAAIEAVCACDVAIFASPTYKATYTGLLKLFLDQIPADGLSGVVGIPMMLGAGPTHALAPELLLKPVLTELGATCPTRGLYVIDAAYAEVSAIEPWLTRAREQIRLAAGEVVVQ